MLIDKIQKNDRMINAVRFIKSKYTVKIFFSLIEINISY